MNDPLVYSMRLAGHTDAVAPGILRRLEAELPDGARLESEVVLGEASVFRECGTIAFSSGSELRFRTLGVGHITPSRDPRLRAGTVTWEVDGGSGRFEGASGRITSNFTLTEAGEVTDEHVGVIFLSV